jgi:hypothetical protein
VAGEVRWKLSSAFKLSARTELELASLGAHQRHKFIEYDKPHLRHNN